MSGQKKRKSNQAEAPIEVGNGSTEWASPEDEPILVPSAQQALVEEAFPDAAPHQASIADEKRAIAEEEVPAQEGDAMPGWGDWGGLGVKPSKRKVQREEEARRAREQLIEEAARRRKDAALKNVIISEKRDKKAAQFTTAGVPFPFKSREQFERSMRNPLGLEWNTTASHLSQVTPKIKTVPGAVISPASSKMKGKSAAQAKIQKQHSQALA